MQAFKYAGLIILTLLLCFIKADLNFPTYLCSLVLESTHETKCSCILDNNILNTILLPSECLCQNPTKNLSEYMVKLANSSVFELFEPNLKDTCSNQHSAIMRVNIEPRKNMIILGIAYFLTFSRKGNEIENTVPVHLKECTETQNKDYTLCGTWERHLDGKECLPIGSLVHYVDNKCSHFGMIVSRDCEAYNFTLLFLNEFNNSEEKKRKKRIVSKNEDQYIPRWYFIGGLHENQTQYFDFDVYQLKKANEIPDLTVNTAYAAAVSVAGTVFFTGGSTEIKNKYLNMTFYLEPTGKEWKQGPNMLGDRAYHSLVYLNGRIYALGGKSSNEFLDSCEYLEVNKIKTKSSAWKRCAPMKEKRSKFATVVYDGKIFVFGGEVITQTYYKFTDSVERYNPEKDTWTTLPIMPSSRSSQIAVVFNDKIYVAGGRAFNAYKRIGTIKTIEIFDPKTNKWKSEYSEAVTANLDPHDPSYLYLLNGNSRLIIYKTDPHHFEEYNTDSHRWSFKNVAKSQLSYTYTYASASVFH